MAHHNHYHRSTTIRFLESKAYHEKNVKVVNSDHFPLIHSSTWNESGISNFLEEESQPEYGNKVKEEE